MAVKLYTMMAAMLIGMMVVFGAGGTSFDVSGRESASDVQKGIAKQILRFHVIANSDRKEDQALKLKVKDEVVAYLQELLEDAEGLEETKECLAEHMEDIEEKAREVIKKEGYSYSAKASMEHTFFPRKTYGDLAFPAGEYEALRIKIGKAEGKNWWCVMYPSLCFVDSIHAVVPEEEKELLKNILTEEEYDSILEVLPEKIHLKSHILEFFKNKSDSLRASHKSDEEDSLNGKPEANAEGEFWKKSCKRVAILQVNR